MNTPISAPDFDRISKFILDRTGLYYSSAKQADLEKGLQAAADELYSGDIEHFIRLLTTQSMSDELCQSLVKYLTIGETYFFREQGTLNFLLSRLKHLIEKRRNAEKSLRIWSAGCCSGEETYSLAILLSRAIPDIDDWDIMLYGTDINHEFIDRALEGSYREWSFRGVPEMIKKNYFTVTEDGGFRVNKNIRNHTKFFVLNLFDNSYPSPVNGLNNLDCILCRNVLMYFNEEGRRHILERFHSGLHENGYLVAGLAELSYIPRDLFEQIRDDNVFIFRKKAARNVEKNSERKNAKPPHNAVWNTDNPAITYTGLPPTFSAGENKLPPETKFSRALKRIIEAKNSAQREKYSLMLFTLLNDQQMWLFGADEEKELLYSLAGNVLMEEGRLPDAKELLERAINELKLSQALYFLYARVLFAIGSYEEALSAYKKCIFLEHNNIPAHYFAALCCSELQRFDEQKRFLRTTAKLLASINDAVIIIEQPKLSVGELKRQISTLTGQSE